MNNSKADLIKKAEDLYFSTSPTRNIPAINAYNRLIEAYPDHLEAYDNKAIMHIEIGQYDEGLKTYDEGLQIAPDKNLLASKFRTLKSIHRMVYSDPYYVNKSHIEYPYQIIEYGGGQQDIRKMMLEMIEGFLQNETDPNKRYDYKLTRAQVLEKMDLLDEAIAAFKDCLIDIPEKKLKRKFLNPIFTHNNAISRLYQRKEDYENALLYVNRAIDGSAKMNHIKSQIKILHHLGKEDEATQTFNQIINDAKDKFIETKDVAYISQQVNLSLEYDHLDLAEKSLSQFEEIEKLNDHQQKTKSVLTDKINAHHSPSAKDKVEAAYDVKELYPEKLQLQNLREQAAGEFINWYHPLSTSYDTPTLLDGLYDVLYQLDTLEFPIAEYNTERDIIDLFGACLGEIFRVQFNWYWRIAYDYENGIVGPIIISPDGKMAILTNEYIKQLKDDNQRDDLQLYNHFKSGKAIPQSDGPIVLGDWKRKLKFRDLL